MGTSRLLVLNTGIFYFYFVTAQDRSKHHGQATSATWLKRRYLHDASVLSRLCRSADVPGIRIQIRPAQGQGGASEVTFHSLVVLGKKPPWRSG